MNRFSRDEFLNFKRPQGWGCVGGCPTWTGCSLLLPLGQSLRPSRALSLLSLAPQLSMLSQLRSPGLHSRASLLGTAMPSLTSQGPSPGIRVSDLTTLETCSFQGLLVTKSPCVVGTFWDTALAPHSIPMRNTQRITPCARTPARSQVSLC